MVGTFHSVAQNHVQKIRAKLLLKSFAAGIIYMFVFGAAWYYTERDAHEEVRRSAGGASWGTILSKLNYDERRLLLRELANATAVTDVQHGDALLRARLKLSTVPAPPDLPPGLSFWDSFLFVGTTMT